MATKPKDYRLKVVDDRGTATFFVRQNGRTFYMSGSETPLALANLVGDASAETRFALDDAFDGTAACKVLREALAKRFERNPPLCPKVTTL